MAPWGRILSIILKSESKPEKKKEMKREKDDIPDSSLQTSWGRWEEQ